VSQKSADIFLALDISQSMLAQDVAPSRLELAKSFARKIVDALHGERIGLIFFAGDAFLQMPLSTDYGAAIMFIDSASPDLITAQGTALTTAIDLAMESFDPEPGGGRALILITDGEITTPTPKRAQQQRIRRGLCCWPSARAPLRAARYQ
jgi:Ca-activated chloride channel family protein